MPLNPFPELLYLGAAFPQTDFFKVRQFAGSQFEIDIDILGLLTSGFPASAFSSAAALWFVAGHDVHLSISLSNSARLACPAVACLPFRKAIAAKVLWPFLSALSPVFRHSFGVLYFFGLISFIINERRGLAPFRPYLRILAIRFRVSAGTVSPRIWTLNSVFSRRLW